jgi:hypothetical protein
MLSQDTYRCTKETPWHHPWQWQWDVIHEDVREIKSLRHAGPYGDIMVVECLNCGQRWTMGPFGAPANQG